MKKKIKWEIQNNPYTGLTMNNMILRGKDFSISYNPDTGRSLLGGILDTSINNLQPDKAKGGGEETALIDEKNGKYYILNGDFRKDYEKLFEKGLKACKEFYDSKKEYHSSFSE